MTITFTPVFLDPVPFGDEPASQTFLLLRYGRTDFTKGEKRGGFEFNERDADAVIGDFSARGKDLVMDYDHATVKECQDAPASGWITSLEPDYPREQAEDHPQKIHDGTSNCPEEAKTSQRLEFNFTSYFSIFKIMGRL